MPIFAIATFICAARNQINADNRRLRILEMCTAYFRGDDRQLANFFDKKLRNIIPREMEINPSVYANWDVGPRYLEYVANLVFIRRAAINCYVVPYLEYCLWVYTTSQDTPLNEYLDRVTEILMRVSDPDPSRRFYGIFGDILYFFGLL